MNNKEFLQGIKSEMSQEFNDKMPSTLSDNGIEVYETLEGYPTLKNEFLDVLTNKIIRTKFLAKVFNNPLKLFHRGNVPFGSTLENIFVEMANSKGFNEHFEDGGNAENDLIGTLKADVKVSYMTRNFRYKYKVTISEEQLRTAFMNSDGLTGLISDMLKSLTNGAYFDEYSDMRNLLKEVCQGNKYIEALTGKLKSEPLKSTDIKQPIKTVTVSNFDAKPSNLSEVVRALSGRMKFPSTTYNMAGVKTFSNSEDLVFLTTPEIVAKLDVNVLAEAFNVSKADLKTRTIEVDELPTKFIASIGGQATDKKCLGILVDKEFIQMYDTIVTMKKFDNGSNLTVNNFLHKQGIIANCYFANAVALIEA